jgi:hypothetical protein
VKQHDGGYTPGVIHDSPAGPQTRAGWLQRGVSAETGWLAAICLLDLVTTLYWVSQGQATEGNAVMARFLSQGHVPFIVAKLAMFVPALVLAEWYRPRNPELVTRVLRWVALAYLVAYALSLAAHYGFRHGLLPT